MKDTVLKFDKVLTKKVAAIFGQSARPFFLTMTSLGDPLTVGIVTVAISIWGLYTNNTLLALSGAVIPATVLVGALLKLAFERARPLTEYAMNMKLKTFSFPSGHSNGATVTYGILAFIAANGIAGPIAIPIIIVLLLIPIFVGISRVYLGAHFPSDVIAGWLVGLVGVSIVLLLIKPVL